MKALNRREMLTTGVVALTAATVPLSEAQGGQTNATKKFTVRTGEARPGGQWLIHGDKAFSTKVSGADVAKAYAAIEVHTPPGYGPELHVHLAENELLFILSGSVGLQCGSDRTILKVGDALMVPANTPHAYVTLGTEPVHMLVVFDPAGDIEGFFAEYASIVGVDGPPDQKKLAEVYEKHGMKVVGPPLKVSSFS